MHRLPALILIVGLVGFTAGCNRFKQPAVFGTDSVNIAAIPPGWPEDYDLTPVQERVLEDRGRPEFFRARWDRRGRLTWGSEVWTTYRRQRVQDIISSELRRGRPSANAIWGNRRAVLVSKAASRRSPHFSKACWYNSAVSTA